MSAYLGVSTHLFLVLILMSLTLLLLFFLHEAGGKHFFFGIFFAIALNDFVVTKGCVKFHVVSIPGEKRLIVYLVFFPQNTKTLFLLLYSTFSFLLL